MLRTSYLSHEDLARWRSCPRHFWLHRHFAPSACTRADHPSHLAEPGVALKASFPQAVDIAPPDTDAEWDQAIAATQRCLAEGWLAGTQHEEGRAILGACLRSNEGVRVRVDVLSAGPYGLRLFKVRHATVGNEADVDAVALWVHVAARSGLRVQSAGLLLVDTDFVYPGLGCYAGLFREVELLPVLGSRAVPEWIVGMRACERGPEPQDAEAAPCLAPTPCTYLPHCKRTHRTARFDDPASLAVLGKELAAALGEAGHANLMTVPPDTLPDARRRRAVRAVQQGRAIIEPEVATLIHKLPHPRHTLRIDTIGFAQPIWPGTRPYQVIPFQWTCDTEPAPGTVVRQTFLATDLTDPCRAFAETLLAALGNSGPILAYNAGFEINRLRELAREFEDLEAPIEALLPRVVDLFQVARGHCYHPQMCGSWSFKSLVRSFVPQVQADTFTWQGFTEAQEAYAHSLLGRPDAQSLASLRQALVAHGQRQTEALRCFVQRLATAAQPGG